MYQITHWDTTIIELGRRKALSVKLVSSSNYFVFRSSSACSTIKHTKHPKLYYYCIYKKK